MNKVRKLNLNDYPGIKSLLKLYDLPVSDLDFAPLIIFGVKRNNMLIGIGALETYGANAIVRSVAVDKKYQNQGLGKEIVQHLEKEAKLIGIKNLYLLTTTAENFFKLQYYSETNRNDCPAEIRLSKEFAEICPSTAACLYKPIEV